jgi:hypothetical protein
MLVAPGCFSEPTSDASCPEGKPGCACGDAGCDAGLMCAQGIDLCIPENCVPGSELCTCNDGQCLTGLVCDGALCRAPAGSETASDDVASSPDVTSDASSDSSTLGTMSGDPETGTASSGMTSTDTGTSVDGNACRACILVANEPSGGCELALEACAQNTACSDLAGCVDGCLVDNDPECIPGCCEVFGAGASEYGGLGSCNANVCGSECDGFGLYCAV